MCGVERTHPSSLLVGSVPFELCSHAEAPARRLAARKPVSASKNSLTSGAAKTPRLLQRQQVQAFESVLPLWLRPLASRRLRSRPLVAVHCHGRSLSDWRAAPTRGHLRSPIRAPRCRGRARARTVRCRALARRRGARGSAAEAIERERAPSRETPPPREETHDRTRRPLSRYVDSDPGEEVLVPLYSPQPCPN